MDQMYSVNHQSISTKNNYCLESREDFNLFKVPPHYSWSGPAPGSMSEYEFRLQYTQWVLDSEGQQEAIEFYKKENDKFRSEKNHIKK